MVAVIVHQKQKRYTTEIFPPGNAVTMLIFQIKRLNLIVPKKAKNLGCRKKKNVKKGDSHIPPC